MGLDIDVVVDRETAGSIVTGLTALPTMRDEMMRIIGERPYGSDFRRDAGALADRVAKEFNDFCLHYNFKALRDSVIGKINYGLAQGPDSGGNPVLQDSQREASVTIDAFGEAQALSHKLWVEMLDELRGIKAAVTPTTVKVDLGAKPPMEMSPELRELLCGSQRTVSDLVEGLRSYTTAIAGEKFSSSRVVHWPSNKAEFVDLVTKAINATNEGNQELPAISLAQLTDNVRMDIVKLLNPSFEIRLGDDPASMVFKHDKQGATNLTNITGVSIIIGNHTFDRNKDGSLKIRTDANGKSSFAVLNTDGGVMLHGPGYMG